MLKRATLFAAEAAAVCRPRFMNAAFCSVSMCRTAIANTSANSG